MNLCLCNLRYYKNMPLYGFTSVFLQLTNKWALHISIDFPWSFMVIPSNGLRRDIMILDEAMTSKS